MIVDRPRAFLLVLAGAVLLALAGAIATTAGCASGLDGYRQAIGTAARSAAATVTTLQSLDEREEAALTARAKAVTTTAQLDAVRVDTASWRRRYDTARAALTAFDLALSAATAAVALADTGQRASVDLGALVGKLAEDALSLSVAVRALTAGPVTP